MGIDAGAYGPIISIIHCRSVLTPGPAVRNAWMLGVDKHMHLEISKVIDPIECPFGPFWDIIIENGSMLVRIIIITESKYRTVKSSHEMATDVSKMDANMFTFNLPDEPRNPDRNMTVGYQPYRIKLNSDVVRLWDGELLTYLTRNKELNKWYNKGKVMMDDIQYATQLDAAWEPLIASPQGL